MLLYYHATRSSSKSIGGLNSYNIFNPEYTIEILEEDERLQPEFYAYNMYNEATHYSLLEIKCYGTKLYSNQIVLLDSGRYATVTPNWEFLHLGEYKTEIDYAFKYFIKHDIDYKLHIFLFNDESHEAVIAHQRLYEVILIFESFMEKEQFVKYLHSHQGQIIECINSIDKTYSWVETTNEKHRKAIIERLKTGIALNRMLEKFRKL